MTRPAMERPPSYLSKSALAGELCVSESTVDEMVRRGVIPQPVRLSPGCVRWRWETVDMALASLAGASDDPSSKISEGVRRAIQASKDSRRGRAA